MSDQKRFELFGIRDRVIATVGLDAAILTALERWALARLEIGEVCPHSNNVSYWQRIA